MCDKSYLDCQKPYCAGSFHRLTVWVSTIAPKRRHLPSQSPFSKNLVYTCFLPMDVGINRNFHFGFTTRTSIPAVASAESVSCIRFHPKGSGRPERAVSGTQSRVSLCFQAIFLTPLRQLPSFVQIVFALTPHAIIRLAPAEPPCAAACLRTGAASDGSLPTTASSSGHALPTGRRSSPAAAASWSTT